MGKADRESYPRETVQPGGENQQKDLSGTQREKSIKNESAELIVDLERTKRLDWEKTPTKTEQNHGAQRHLASHSDI
jgi:hypothetical protein